MTMEDLLSHLLTERGSETCVPISTSNYVTLWNAWLVKRLDKLNMKNDVVAR